MAQGMVGFISTTAAKYFALQAKDNDALYFLDDGRLYKGSTLIGNNVRLVDSYPTDGEPGILYVNSVDGSTKVWNSNTSQFVTVTKETVNIITENSTVNQIPSAKAVYDFVKNAVPADYATLQSQVQQNKEDLTAIQHPTSGVLALAKNYTDELRNGQVATNATNISALQENKAEKSTTLAGYGITDAYTKTQADTAMREIAAGMEHLKREIVDALPAINTADIHTIYMVKRAGVESGQAQYDEYMLINGTFERIGDSSVNMEGYITEGDLVEFKTEVLQEAGQDATTKVNGLAGVLNEFKTITEEALDEHSQALESINNSSSGILAQAKEYTDSKASNYATAEQGAKADSALQSSDITTGTQKGTISVKGNDVSVAGLKSAAYTSSTDYDAAGSAKAAEDNAKAYANTLLTWQTLS